MNHYELLARLDTAIDKRKRIYGTIGTRSPEIPRVLTDYHNTGISFLLALRAIVELHKPVLDTFPYGLELDPPEVTQRYECNMCGTGSSYPCPTIQAIERELK